MFFTDQKTMIHLSRHSNSSRISNNGLSEIDSIKTHKSSAKPRLPRHISSLESKTHTIQERWRRESNSVFEPNSSSSQAIDLAVNISRYQLRDRASIQKHSENVRSSLERRLRVAIARGNYPLVALLQAEFEQLQAVEAGKSI